MGKVWKMGAGQSSSNTSKSPALEDQLDEANAARALLQSKVLQLENELESAKRREKTNVVEELNSRKKFVAFVQESLMPNGSEVQKHLDQLNAKIESIDEGTDLNDFDVKVPDPDYDKLKLEALSNVDEREKSIDIIKKIRTMFPDRSDEDIFKDIKAVKEKNGNTLKNLSADHIVDQIIENTENANDEGVHDFEISTFTDIKYLPFKNPNYFTEPECCICHDPLSSQANRKLNCGHLFHRSCIGNWLKQQKNCPICRRGPTMPSRGQYRGRGGRGRRRPYYRLGDNIFIYHY